MKSPFEGNATAWSFVSKDKKETLIFYFEVLAKASKSISVIKFAGLDETAVYLDSDGNQFGGDELMNIGRFIPAVSVYTVQTDFTSHVWHLKQK
ncbi:GH36 C-terminal domain-containing protein [Paenibacillus sophorae]|uniref:GH36 C-terminal domain-containing protein n=1 Tax=Paenibacillus sophorae TaxID=1333845 RepID=A0ABX8HGQ1_9BACL|nr:GH36 C-terminal domain-containing protein [Paenibacillus sophorae]QWU16866.1 GH36 C-terminal domain-containing protein [Paenibacillus sophorae]